jgi:hypothetical protein
LVVGSAESGTFTGRSVVKNGENKSAGNLQRCWRKKEKEKKKAGDTINKKK